MAISESDKFNDRVFGTAWLGIGLLILWMGFYIMIALPDQPFSDIAYFCSLIFFFLGTGQVRRGRDMKIKLTKIKIFSNITYIVSICIYCGCLIWFKFNFAEIVEQETDLTMLRYAVASAFVLLTLAVLINLTPLSLATKINQFFANLTGKRAKALSR